MRRLSVLAALLLSTPLSAQDPEVARVESDPITVATHYFYWYRWPDEHFDPNDDPAREGHTHQLPEPDKVSYLDSAWHRDNFTAMAACGIDVALPVYWGAPGAYDRPNLRFSVAGLDPMVQALDAIAGTGARAPKLGLFYDTSTLWNAVRGVTPGDAKADLTTESGRALFCGTVVEYFARIPERHWARHRGGVLVVLYTSGFAARWDETLGAVLRAAFGDRFPGATLCLVADASWGEIGQDLTTAWGAALRGPRLFPGVAQIGPGYDDTPVPGRQTPIRDREGGAFYRHSWRAVHRHRPHLVLLETWNEMHEGTEICATRQTGRRYLELTTEAVAALRQRADPGPAIALRHPEPRPRPDRSWGRDARDEAAVTADYRGAEPSRTGLRERSWADGPLDLQPGLLRSPAPGVRYVYFQVSDHWRFDQRGDFELLVTHRPGAVFFVEYDSFDAKATLVGAYTSVRAASVNSEGGWSISRFPLPDARFANRQNGGADLRLSVRGPRDLEIGVLELRPGR